MQIQLYVYDLTHGMARTMSRQFLGIQIDAVYHTSLVFGNIEYFFGAGVQTCRPGTTHHGQPMEKVNLGTTHLPLETILEYLESLKQVYTPESYDLFAHNCNNFTNDFAMFLVGRGIPDHITSLPRRVLDTPFGQMLKPQLDAGMRGVTQAPVAPQNAVTPTANGAARAPQPPITNGTSQGDHSYGEVVNVTDITVLDKYLTATKSTATTIFFTSSTCGPCRMAYPTYDSLAASHPNCLFLKIDINAASAISSRYAIRATPTFMTFSKGSKQDEWQGADPNLLKVNVERLINATFPPHPHLACRVPSLQFGSMKAVTYPRVPPLDKLMAKLGDAGKTERALVLLKDFIEKRNKEDAREATLPDLKEVGLSFRSKMLELPLEVRFAAVDLLRCAMVDVRVSGFFAEERESTVEAIVEHVVGLGDQSPHNLRLVTIHLASNIFTSPLYTKELMKGGNPLSARLVELITTALLDTDHSTTRVAAAWLGFNLAVNNYRVRREENREGLAEGEQIELAASLIECLSSEQNPDAVKAMLLTLGYLVYCAPEHDELMDLSKALNAKETVLAVKESAALAKEVASLL